MGVGVVTTALTVFLSNDRYYVDLPMNSPIAATTLEAREKRTCHTISPCADCATSLSAKAAARSAACTRPGDWPLTFSGSSSDFLSRRTRRVMRSTRSKSEKQIRESKSEKQ